MVWGLAWAESVLVYLAAHLAMVREIGWVLVLVTGLAFVGSGGPLDAQLLE